MWDSEEQTASEETETAVDEEAVEETKEAENTKKLEAQWKNIKETIATGMTDAIMGLIDGTKSLGESLASIAKQIASMALKSAITSILPFAEGGYARNGIKAFSSGGMARTRTTTTCTLPRRGRAAK